ncbi:MULTISPECIES: hypothetical protein [unclassified Bradyrhizobium]|uniref:hypothetical protein n=1 Tax=unclassified Bradyrhizobium TaxID=2631580 RepID=UPI00201124EC|nr:MULTISPECIES: hypothetical protein [unclassified Bradyrhizobium]
MSRPAMIALLVLLPLSAHADDLAPGRTRQDPARAGSAAWSTKPPASTTTAPVRARTSNPCSQFGPGFVQIEGGSTCIQAGGGLAISAGTGSSR